MSNTQKEMPEWFDGKKINEILFCEAFRKEHPMICINDQFFTVDGLIADPGKLETEIFNTIRHFVTEKVSNSVKSLMEVLKLMCHSEPLHQQLAAGYTDVERGERGSTEEHLTVTQFKVQQEAARLEVLEAQTEKKEQQLQRIEQKTKIKKSQGTTFDEIDNMGRKTFTGKIEFTPHEAEQLKNLAKKTISASAVIADLKKKLEAARQDARIWKDRYESLQAQTKDFLAALKKAPEAVKNFISRILHMEKKEPEREKKQQEHTLVK